MSYPNDPLVPQVFEFLTGAPTDSHIRVLRRTSAGYTVQAWPGTPPSVTDVQGALDDTLTVSGQTFSQWYAAGAKTAIKREAARRIAVLFVRKPETFDLVWAELNTAVTNQIRTKALLGHLLGKGTLPQLDIDTAWALMSADEGIFTMSIGGIRGTSNAMDDEIDVIAVDTGRTPTQRRGDLDTYAAGIGADVAQLPRTVEWP